MKVGTITFHAAHNCGAMLQAYALQQVLQEMGFKVNIINFRTQQQRKLYALKHKHLGLDGTLKNWLKRILFPSIRRRYMRFENFLSTHTQLTPEYTTLRELNEHCQEFDAYICGSDQIWNTSFLDFSEAYLLPFAGKRKRIAYAVSFGSKKILSNTELAKQMKYELSKYAAISVREYQGAEQVYALTGKTVPVTLDPVFLIPVELWEKLAENARIVVPRVKYILFYSLIYDTALEEFVRDISNFYHLPVLITIYRRRSDFFSTYIKKTDGGPLEFLALLKNAEFVVTSSFHGTAFSVLFNKPFFSYDGATDARMETLLKKCGLLDRAIDKNNAKEKIPSAFTIDFTATNTALTHEIYKSKAFLADALLHKEGYAD